MNEVYAKFGLFLDRTSTYAWVTTNVYFIPRSYSNDPVFSGYNGIIDLQPGTCHVINNIKWSIELPLKNAHNGNLEQ